ncbi:MAG TPA: type II toxin-antitoxin system RelE/ParE family toxin [Stellaceae bacterium]|nr:type II toxin-antitoxin system RelE/ParE family toxin [Stellaceae bacterium]
MKKHKISFRPLAEADLFRLYRSIAEKAGHEVAGAYIDRIEAACKTLETFPERGTRRDDIRPGLRTLGFERRATIVFQVRRAEVVIVRIFYGGRDYESALGRESGKLGSK